MDVSQHEIKEIIHDAVEAAVAKAVAIEAEVHAEHHIYLKCLIAQSRARTAMYRKILENVLGWAVIGLATYVGAAVLAHIKKGFL